MRPILLALAMAAALLNPTPALADNSQPPHHTPLSSVDMCGPISIYTYCVSGTGQQTITPTPSGNLSTTVHGTLTITVTYQNRTIWTETQQIREHTLTKADGTVIQEQGNRYTAVLTVLGTRFCLSGDYHVTRDGRFQFDRPTRGC